MINLGVIGAGHWGPNLIRNFHNGKASRVVAVADLDEARLEQVANHYADVLVTAEAKDVIAADVDAVVIATPTSTHYELARLALENKRHVLVEKPVATSSVEATELCELAETNSRVLMVGHVFLFNSGVQRVKQYIDDGDLGRIYYASMVRTNLGPIRMDVSAAWDLAAHDISIANYWLDSGPVSASGTGGNWINDGLEDAVFATLRYPNDVLVNLHVSWLNPRKNRDITVVGERKMLTLDDMNLSEPIRVYDKGVSHKLTTPNFVDTFASFRASVREGDITVPRVSLGEPLQEECDHFLHCIANGGVPVSNGRTGLSVVCALEAIERSMRKGGREEPVAQPA